MLRLYAKALRCTRSSCISADGNWLGWKRYEHEYEIDERWNIIIMKKKITILVPCYNEEKCILILYSKLVSIISLHQQYDWEIPWSVEERRWLPSTWPKIYRCHQAAPWKRAFTKFFAGQASTTSVINSMNFHYNHKTIIKKNKNVTKRKY